MRRAQAPKRRAACGRAARFRFATALAAGILSATFALATARSARAADAAGPGASADTRVLVIHAGTLLDGTGAAPRKNVDLLVRDGRIADVGTGLAVPPGAEEIDLRDYTVLPGLIDCHTHLTMQITKDAQLRTVREGPADAAILGTVDARRTLEAGFTTVRNVGAKDFVDVALKRAIDQGLVPGPRMITATNALSIVGGHGDRNGYRPGVLEDHLDYTEGICTGADECRKAVRYAHKHGAGVIKIMSSGGVLSEGDAVSSRQFSDEELAAIVDEAHHLGLKVCCHAHGAEGIKAAIRAGVSSIEHGTYLDDEGIALMKQRGTFLVPTRMAGEWVASQAETGGLPPYAVAKAREVGPIMRQSFHRAVLAGVKIAFGTDAGVYPHGQNAHEFKLLVDGGMRPMDAIVAATGSAAELLGWNEVGLVQKGRYADLDVVEGDPLADISLLERPIAVFKGGVPVRDDRAH